jgi:hypothetical protein
MTQSESPHEHAHTAPSWCRRALLESNRSFSEPVCLMVLDTFLQQLIGKAKLPKIVLRR